MKRWAVLGFLVAIAAALGLRLPQLGQRPMHTDEAVHAVKFLGLWEGKGYKYDPNEYHGPLLYYATLPLAWLGQGKEIDEATLRLVPVLTGILLIALLWLCLDALGPPAAVWSALLTALSPAMVYYSRYYIHELLLVLFSFVFIAALCRYTRSPRTFWAALAGASLGAMHATKETLVFNLVAMAGAGLVVWYWRREAREPLILGQVLGLRKHLLILVVSGFAVSFLFFTSFFQNPAGPLDSVRTYLPWLHRAGGASPHANPWYFYFERLLFFHTTQGPIWTEVAILVLGIYGMIQVVRGEVGTGSIHLYRFLAVYTLLLTGVYTFISYKTPWCALGFWHGWILMAGLGCHVALRAARSDVVRVSLVCLLAAALLHLAYQARLATTTYSADRRNPHVYAHTSAKLLDLVERVRGITAASGQKENLRVNVIAKGGDYWPLPWYFRNLTQLGWWTHLPPDPFAPIVIVGSNLGAELDERSNKKWVMTGLYEHRQGVKVWFEMYVEFELWKKYLSSRPPPADED